MTVRLKVVSATAPEPVSEPPPPRERYLAPLVVVFGAIDDASSLDFGERVCRAAVASAMPLKLIQAGPLPNGAEPVVAIGPGAALLFVPTLCVMISDGMPLSRYRPEARALRKLVDVTLVEPRPQVAVAVGRQIARMTHKA